VQQPDSLSPWSVGQIAELEALSPSPSAWLDGFRPAGLDAPLGTFAVAERAGSPTAPFDPIQGPVEEILGDYLDERGSELASIEPKLVAVAEQVAGLIAAGGKRLRPAFVYWGHQATGAGHDASVYLVAAAVEMLHTFALLHDDVMDRAPTRRGRPSAQRSFAAVHQADQLAGDAAWFGASAAILAGDLAFVWADDLIERAELSGTAAARVRKVFTTLRTEVMAGQYLDLRLDGFARADVAAARHVALLKSGRYTVTRPLALGQAIACGGDTDTDTARSLSVYGDALGLAFQMRDDVLGLFGDPAVTGKSHMSDLREGKRTVLILRTLALATASERAVFERALGNPELDDADAERCREIVTSSGALASVETLIRTQHAAAVEAATGLPEPARGALRALASTVVDRAS
jgi:geranylgeranyl diphosphate synthase type I